MEKLQSISRRNLLRFTLAAGVGLAIPTTLFGKQCPATAAQVEGPFYMNTWDRTRQVHHINDLTWSRSPDQVADGEVIYLAGQVTDPDCRPMPGVMVEIWQACATGKYAHLADPNPAKMDPNFRYFGESITDKNGMYSFKTIKPGPYPVTGDWIRPAHIHFKISAGLQGMLTTQSYFAGDPYLDKDPLIKMAKPGEREKLILEPTRRSGGSEDLYTFNIHLVPFI